MAICQKCRCALPAGSGVPTRVMRGYGGRRHAGTVLMCASCSNAAGSDQKVAAIIVLVIMGLVGLVLALAQAR